MIEPDRAITSPSAYSMNSVNLGNEDEITPTPVRAPSYDIEADTSEANTSTVYAPVSQPSMLSASIRPPAYLEEEGIVGEDVRQCNQQSFN